MQMRYFLPAVLALIGFLYACQKPSSTSPAAGGTGLKIAYVNGDTILHKFAEFRKQSDVMEAKQRKAEDELTSKGAALEKEIMAYQKKAQSGTMTGKEMEAHEKYLSSRQEALLAERDKIAKAIMEETESINKRLQDVLHQKLNAIKEKEGYDFILSYVEGGAILTADAKYDITDQVLKMLNEDKSIGEAVADTTKR